MAGNPQSWPVIIQRDCCHTLNYLNIWPCTMASGRGISQRNSFCSLPQDKPTLKNKPTPLFFSEVVAKGASPSIESKPTYLCCSTSGKLSKQRSNIAVEERLTNKGRYHLLLLHKQAHDKRGIVESQHAYINRAKTNCMWGIFTRNIITL